MEVCARRVRGRPGRGCSIHGSVCEAVSSVVFTHTFITLTLTIAAVEATELGFSGIVQVSSCIHDSCLP